MTRRLRTAAPVLAGLLLLIVILVPLRLGAQVQPPAPAPDGIPLTGAQVDVQPGLAPLVLAPEANAVPDRYIVVFKPSRAFSTQEVRSKALTARDSLGATVRYVYEAALTGYTADLTPGALAAVRGDPDVAFVQQDAAVAKADEQISPPWNLDRIDQRNLPIDGLYRYGSTGAGVHVYIVDTGILAAHKEFTGRIGTGYDSIDGGAPEDCDGHGTHVAGIIGGASVGVAKGVTLHGVRVLNCDGEGTDSSVIAGLDWVTANRQTPAVINMSLGGEASDALDLAIRNAVNSGIVNVVAAGNHSRNACLESPSREPLALTVGATGDIDHMAYFSNYGSCLDLFAPGYNIRSAYINTAGSTNEQYETLSGTSMAAPHVTGAVALYLAANPSAAPAAVTAAILNAATRGVVIDGGVDSPNLLLYTGSDADPQPTLTPTATATVKPGTPGPTKTPPPPPSPTPTPTRRPDSLTISAIQPNLGPNDAANEVTILGTNFRAGIAGALGTAPLLNVRLVSPTELRAVVPAGLPPSVYTLRLKNADDLEPARLADGYTVMQAEAEDYWAAAEDLWTDPATVRQGQEVRLGLNVHRHGGRDSRAVEVRFFRLIARSEGGAEQLEEIGRVTTPPFAPGEAAVEAVSVPWDTTGLPNRVTVVAIIDPQNSAPEPIKANNRVLRALTVQPAGDGAAPVLGGLTLNGGAAETAGAAITVTLAAGETAAAGAADAVGPAAMYLVEREYVLAARQWVAVQSTGWLPFAPTHVLTLTEHGGLRYIQAWVSDGAGNISREAATAGINYNPPSSSVLKGQVRIYRLALAAGQVLSVTLQPTAGDADLYVWAPSHALGGYSNGDGLTTDSVRFAASEDGDYQIEVYGYEDATYGLTLRVLDAGALGTTSPAVVAPSKTQRTQPATAPDSAPAVQMALPDAAQGGWLYLPAIQTQ